MKIEHELVTIETLPTLQRHLLEAVKRDLPIAFDIETGYEGAPEASKSLDPFRGLIVGMSFATETGFGHYIPIEHEYVENLDLDVVIGAMKPILETGKIIAHNAKFEKRWLRRQGVEINIFSDTLIEAYLMGCFESLGLKSLSKEVLGHDQAEIDSLFPPFKNRNARKAMRFNELPVTDAVVSYAVEDSCCALALHERHYDKVKDMLLFKVEMGIVEITADMEDRGIAINWEQLTAWSGVVTQFSEDLNKEIMADLSAMIGKPVAINLNSGPVLGDILFKQAGLPTSRKTPTGKPSTDAVALESLSKQFGVVRKILDWRELQALQKRFLTKWVLEYNHHVDGRARASFNQTGVDTGRFAVNDPPLQQCPKRKKYELATGQHLDVNFRDAIVPEGGYYFLDFDYSQIELRVMAGLSQELALMRAFDNDEDPHKTTASMMLGVPMNEVSPSQRDIGKTMNFALLYGMGVRSLADRLAITRERASDLNNAFFSSLPNIRTWMETMKNQGKSQGYTISKFGRKFTIHEYQSSDMAVYSKGDRLCVNAPVQGGAADYMKIAMFRVAKELKERGLWNDKIRLVMNNHDALTFEVHESIPASEAEKIIRPCIEFPVEGFPKIVAEFKHGHHWGSMVDLSEQMEVQPEPNGTRTELTQDRVAADEVLPGIPEVGKPLKIIMESMPTREQFERLLTIIDVPGPNPVTLITPDGEVPLDIMSGIGPEATAELNAILPGTLVHLTPEDVSDADIFNGIDL